jgi:hypothetical protein
MRKNAGKTRGKPFAKGNPGKPKGARHKTTVAIEALLEGEAEGIGRKCIEMALEGDGTALRLAMERIAPVRRARLTFTMPAVETIADLPKAVGAILKAVANGTLSPEEASAIGGAISLQSRVLEVSELDRRITALEERGPR